MKSLILGSVLVASVASGPACGVSGQQTETGSEKEPRQVRVDSVPEVDESTRYSKLSDEDFRIVAEELGVEVAAIKAVVSIEAGANMKGFWAPGVPVINFDRTMYNRFRSKAKDKSGAKGEKCLQDSPVMPSENGHF